MSQAGWLQMYFDISGLFSSSTTSRVSEANIGVDVVRDDREDVVVPKKWVVCVEEFKRSNKSSNKSSSKSSSKSSNKNSAISTYQNRKID